MPESSSTIPAHPQGMVFCPACTAQIAACAPVCIKCGTTNPAAIPPPSDKNIIIAALLCFFFGIFGVHRFYVGKRGTGAVFLALLLLMLASPMVMFFLNPLVEIFLFSSSALAVFIWALIDFIMICAGCFRDDKGLCLKLPPAEEPRRR